MHILHHVLFIIGERCLPISEFCVSPILLNEVQLAVEFQIVQAQVTSVFIKLLKQ